MDKGVDRKITADQEIAAGERFEFGKNWDSFSRKIDNGRIQQAMLSIQDLLKGKPLAGRAFLDVGSASGLMSLAARKLGMHVISFDYDPVSVAFSFKKTRLLLIELRTYAGELGCNEYVFEKK